MVARQEGIASSGTDRNNFDGAMRVIGLRDYPTRRITRFIPLMEDIWGAIWDIGDGVTLSMLGEGDHHYANAFSATLPGGSLFNKYITEYVELCAERFSTILERHAEGSDGSHPVALTLSSFAGWA